VGLVQRRIEEEGFSTVTLSPVPDLTAAVGAPRVAAVEHPLGRSLGLPGDVEGQTAVLRAALRVLETARNPGTVQHLPFKWPESVARARRIMEPSEPPPIVGLLKRKPWLLPHLWNLDPPRSG